MTRVHVPNNPDALQQAVDRSEPGQVLVLPTEANYGPLVLPPRRLDIGIVCDDYHARFGAVRRLPLQQNLPCIASDSQTRWPVTASFGTSGVQFAGVRIRNTRRDNSESYVTICVCLGKDGDTTTDASAYHHLPSRIAFDRCDIGGEAGSSNTLIGVLANGTEVSLDGCRIKNIHHGRMESQGVLITNTPGPVSVTNSEILAGSINLLCGGSSPTIPGVLVCSKGLNVVGNWLHKVERWRDKSVLVKNLLELKNCHSAFISRNVLEKNWLDGQNGMAVLFTPREHNPIMYSQSTAARPAPLTMVDNVSFVRNVLRDVDGGISILAADDIRNPDGTRQRTQATGTIDISDNCISGVGAYGKNGWAFSVGGTDETKPIDHLCIDTNVVSHHDNAKHTASAFLFFEGIAPAVREFFCQNNLYTRGKYHVMATGGAQNAKALGEWAQRGEWTENVCSDASDADFEWSK